MCRWCRSTRVRLCSTGCSTTPPPVRRSWRRSPPPSGRWSWPTSSNCRGVATCTGCRPAPGRNRDCTATCGVEPPAVRPRHHVGRDRRADGTGATVQILHNGPPTGALVLAVVREDRSVDFAPATRSRTRRPRGADIGPHIALVPPMTADRIAQAEGSGPSIGSDPKRDEREGGETLTSSAPTAVCCTGPVRRVMPMARRSRPGAGQACGGWCNAARGRAARGSGTHNAWLSIDRFPA